MDLTSAIQVRRRFLSFSLNVRRSCMKGKRQSHVKSVVPVDLWIVAISTSKPVGQVAKESVFSFAEFQEMSGFFIDLDLLDR